MKTIILILVIILSTNLASAIYINNLNVGLGNGAYIMVDDTNITSLVLKSSINTLEYVINGSTIDYTTLTNKTIASPSFNVTLDNFTAYVSGSAGDLNISAIMNNESEEYNLTANDIHIEYKNSSNFALVYFNYTGAYPASLTIKWNLTFSSELKGYVINILEAPINLARIDVNTTHVFTDGNGFYNFGNIKKGNYTILVRQIGYKNDSQLFAVNGTISWHNVTLLGQSGGGSSYVRSYVPAFAMFCIILILILYAANKRKQEDGFMLIGEEIENQKRNKNENKK